MTELTSLVSHGDVLAAVKTLHGQFTTLLDFSVSSATSSVQGFLSLILRVSATVRTVPDTVQQQTTFIIKRLPVMKEHLELILDTDFFYREIQYFNKALPILKIKQSNLPVVHCLAAYDNTIVMEDLCASGYRTLSNSMDDVGKGSLKISHVRLVMRKLAQLHAASLDVDWLKKLPELKVEGLFEGSGKKMMESHVNSGITSVTSIINEVYPSEKYKKYNEWLLSTKCYEKIVENVKPSTKYFNVLGHGDFWENNMMFKIDPVTNIPIDVKFIDLQLVRFAPLTIDLLYFLYLCTDKKFRDTYETEILDTYLSAFNTAICETPDRLSLEVLRRQYDEGRLFGAMLCAFMRPAIFLVESAWPGEDEEMTKEQLDKAIYGIAADTVLRKFRSDETFKLVMMELVDELVEEMDRAGVV